MERAGNALELLSQVIPADLFTFVVQDGCNDIFRHRKSGLPLAAALASDGKSVFGIILTYRDESDALNMQMTVPIGDKQMCQFTVGFISKQYDGFAPIEDGMEARWDRFKTTLHTQFPTRASSNQKRAASPDDAAEPAPESKRRREEEPTECMICLDAPADTLVTPCMHSVVCAACSAQLKNSETPDARICCRCRCPITGVFYPDNHVEAVPE